MKLVSQSEADAFNNCKRKHYYSFGEPVGDSHGIEPLAHGASLTKGTIGHEILDVYYTKRMDGVDHKDAYEAALGVLAGKGAIPDVLNYVIELTPILARYFTTFGDESSEWQPLAVEKEFRYEIPGTDYVFPFRVDGIFREVSTGHIYVWDHKFLYNYYMPNTLKIMPQMPKYIYALRNMGFDIYDGMYNMLSTRKNSKEPFRRVSLQAYKTPQKSRQFFKEQLITTQNIDKMKALPNEEWRELAVRTASAFNCKNCSFLSLCTDDLEGNPGRGLAIQNFYRPNSYRYGEIEDSE